MTAPATSCVPPGPAGELSVTDIRGQPLRFLQALTRTYGDVVRYRTPGLEVTLLNRPGDVIHVLQENERNYTKVGTPDMMMLRPMLGESLMTSEGASWQRQRHAVLPSLVRHEVERFGPLMAGVTRRMVERWRDRAQPSEPMELCAEMTRLTLEIAAEAMFGFDAGSTSATFGAAVDSLNQTMGHIDPGDPAVAARFREALSTVRHVVDRVVAAAEADGGGGPLLLAAHRGVSGPDRAGTEVRDQVLTLLLAGHETTAKALSWALYLVSVHPECEDRLVAEVEGVVGNREPTVADLPRMPYGWMVLREAMRLYPPIWIISRVALAPDQVGSYEIPAGSLVCMSPFLLHRHPQHWPDPDRFDPERFAGDPSPGPHDGYLPFSIGPRLCIGRQFATVEVHLVLATLVQSCRFRLTPGHPVEPEALVTLRPRQGLPMVVSPR